jgi:glyoxylase-like metal-dependent hydrolase (beta-lactamase superfamily II)
MQGRIVGMSNQPDWTEPGAYAVCEGVHRIPLPLPMDGLRAVNVYVIETEHGLTLVDGGWAIELARKQLEDSLRCLGHTPRDITSFLVTHAHRDHYTQAVAIRSEFGRATVALGLGDKPTLDLVNSALDENPFVRRLYACGAVEVARAWAQSGTGAAPDVAVWQPPDTWLEGDQVIEVGSRRLRAVPTPGHTAGHFVFADLEAGLLFAGDHVLPTITPSVGFEAANESEPLRDYLDSLVRVRALPDLRLLPAHGSVTTQLARPGRRAVAAPRVAVAAVARRGRIRPTYPVRGGERAALDTPRAQFRRARRLQRRHGGDGDQGPPRPAGHPRPARARAGRPNMVLLPPD